MNDYERIARVIRYLAEHHAEHPDLKTMARQIQLSPFHFHRLFSNWAGVTPKDFLQCLTIAHAKEMLHKGESVLDAALETGLSGPARLHDLCIQLEAASPGELKFGGQGWVISYGFVESPFGECLIAESPRGICHLAFVENKMAASAELQNSWPEAKIRRNDSATRRLAAKIFNGDGGPQPQSKLRAFIRGTPFQVHVWRALLRIRPGALATYSRLAKNINHPTAARAVGSAVGKNPLAYLIPCHRVIRETGVIGDYHWGRERKRAMIVWESAQDR